MLFTLWLVLGLFTLAACIADHYIEVEHQNHPELATRSKDHSSLP